MNHRVYRYAELFKPDNTFEAIFAEIPFLNGGLFDCLDYRDDKGKEVRIDCYSDNSKNSARMSVPDRLFFGSDVIDLSGIYDDRRKGAVEVRGIIDILNSYKFTIAENTPVEEEIALDPELLGRVFENLLASYNPETQNTARKQTGSFYTPREIVNYMVDESLKAYLATTLGNDEETRNKLAHVLDYGDDLPDLTTKQTQQIIDALENAKILDPACGSGAFPMGVLQKMVHVLEKLDPKNEHWKQALIKRTPPEIRKDTEKMLAVNTADYIRKLGIIQNCIYGVDIQPIAIQVSKLRFFISLLVDFTVDKSKDNFGIQPLPNLDYKLMQGNSLIEDFHGFTLNLKEQDTDDNSGHLFCENVKVINLIEDLWDRQGEYLRESRPNQKEKLREEVEKDMVNIFDTYIQQKKAPYFAELKKINEMMLAIPNEKTRAEYLKAEKTRLDKKYNFDYDVIKSELKDFTHGMKPRNFFPWQLYFADVFKKKGGFDIVIGNPPYILLQNMGLTPTMQDRLNKLYYSAQYKVDTYHLFTELGIRMLNKNGVITYITPNTFIKNKHNNKLREIIFTNTMFLELVLFYVRVFNDPSVDNAIFVLKNDNSSQIRDENIIKIVEVKTSNFQESLNNYITLRQSEIKKPNYYIEFSNDDESADLINEIESKSVKLGDIAKTYFGIQTFDRSSYVSEQKINKNYLPVIDGTNVLRYNMLTHKEYLDFRPENIKSGGRTEVYSQERIVVRQIGKYPEGCYCKKDLLTLNTIYNIYLTNKKYDIYYILGVINSSITRYYWLNRYFDNKETFPKIKKQPLESIPIIKIGIDSQNTISGLVKNIIAKKISGEETSDMEAEIDSILYQALELGGAEIAMICSC